LEQGGRGDLSTQQVGRAISEEADQKGKV